MAKKSRFCKDRLSYYLLDDKRNSSLGLTIPFIIKRAFAKADFSACPEQELFREVLARRIFDALGHTGLQKPEEHNVAVSKARAWFKFCQTPEDIVIPDEDDVPYEISVQEVIDLSGLEADARVFARVILSDKLPVTAWKDVREIDYCEKPEKGLRSRRIKKEI